MDVRRLTLATRYPGLQTLRTWAAGGVLSLLVCCALGCNLARTRCAMQPNIELPELVSHLNHNSERMQSWQCKAVKISAQGGLGLAPSLAASVCVDQNRKFRLIAQSPIGNEVDIGSNPERFWFWVKRADEPGIYTCKHEAIHLVQQQMPLPFEPDWLIECLGVVPIDPTEVTWEKHPTDPKLAFLKRSRQSPNGETVELTTMVDTCKGVILEHSLIDGHGRTIARAELNEYAIDKATGVALPHRVVLEWPQEKMGLMLRLGHIEVNPTVNEQMYALPNMPRYPTYDLSLDARGLPLQEDPVGVEQASQELSFEEIPADEEATGRVSVDSDNAFE